MTLRIAKLMFLNTLSTMKQILDLGEYKMGKNSSEFCYYKKKVMDYTFESLKKTFKTLEENKIIKKCPNKCNLRQGYKDCLCGGSGYINYEK